MSINIKGGNIYEPLSTHFFTGRIGHVEVPNRTVMSAMGTNMSDHGFVNDAIINHYVERAKGGVGLVIVEVTCVDAPLGLNTLNMLVADDDKYIPGLTKLAAAIHGQGAKCFLQISHTGRGANGKISGRSLSVPPRWPCRFPI